MNKVVLDTSALLAYLFNEKGSDKVLAVLEEGLGLISSVNYAELVSKLVSKGMPMPEILEAVNSLELKFIPQDERQAQLTGQLWGVSKPFGLSLGDRSCLALGEILAVPVMTADKIWLNVTTNIKVQCIR